MHFRARILFAIFMLVAQVYAQSESTTVLQNLNDDTTLRNEVDSSTTSFSNEETHDSIVNFAANPDDLEDVLLKETVTPFTGLQLEETSTTKKVISTNGDERNVYKVTRNKVLQPKRKIKLDSNNVEDFHSFDVYKQLFDQSQWSWEDISKVLKGQCAKDMQMFLDGLEEHVKWALEGI